MPRQPRVASSESNRTKLKLKQKPMLLATTSEALAPSSDALVSTSFLLLLYNECTRMPIAFSNSSPRSFDEC